MSFLRKISFGMMAFAVYSSAIPLAAYAEEPAYRIILRLTGGANATTPDPGGSPDYACTPDSLENNQLWLEVTFVNESHSMNDLIEVRFEDSTTSTVLLTYNQSYAGWNRNGNYTLYIDNIGPEYLQSNTIRLMFSDILDAEVSDVNLALPDYGTYKEAIAEPITFYGASSVLLGVDWCGDEHLL